MGERKKRALIIGINNYDNEGFGTLNYAVKDANRVHDILKNKEIGDFDDLILLNNNPTKYEVEAKLEKLLERTQKDDLVLIYFAGHGKLDRTDRLCLATRDTKIETLRATSVPLDIINGMLEKTCEHKVFVIDSCYSGAAKESIRGDVPPELFEEFEAGTGKIIISASKAFGGARERDDIKHGIFTYYFLKGLEDGEADDGEDPDISIDKLYKYISEKVEDETGHNQKPGKWPEKVGTEIFIAKSIKNKKKIILEKLIDYYNSGEIAGPTSSKAHKIIKKPFSTLNDREKMYFKYIEDLLSKSIDIEFFNTLWANMEKFERPEKERVQPQIPNALQGKQEPTMAPRQTEIETNQKKEHEGQSGDIRSHPEEKGVNEEANQAVSTKKEDASQVVQTSAPNLSETGRTSTAEQKPDPKREQPLNLVRDQIFISYSDKDKVWLERFQGTLKIFLQNEPNLKVWDNTRIEAGTDQEEEIKNAIAAAKFAVLLVSPDFLEPNDDDSLKKDEWLSLLEAAKKKELTILWIAVRESPYKQTGLKPIKPVNDPKKPLAALKLKDDQDKELNKICEIIMKAVKS